MIGFRIIKFDVAQSYFTGEVMYEQNTAAAAAKTTTYKANIQGQRRDKILKMPQHTAPYGIRYGGRVLVRVTGPNGLYVEDWLTYGGESEWLEIDSDAITYYMADHQDMLDTIEVDTSRPLA